MIEHLLPLVQLLLVPAVGLLWRISIQLQQLTTTTAHHADRLDRLEAAHDRYGGSL